MERLVRALRDGFAQPPPDAAPVIGRILDALAHPAPAATIDGAGTMLPACDHLDAAIANAREAGDPSRDAAAAIAAMAPELAWFRRADAEATNQPFYDGHANAQLIGPKGLETRHDVMVGLSLVAPEVRYVDHNHPPEEVYLVLSRGEWRNDAQPWWEPMAGGIVHNPPAITHAMRAGAAPLFAVWCLWTGDIEGNALA